MKLNINNKKIYVLLSIIFIIIDLLSKFIMEYLLSIHKYIWEDNFLSFVLVYNYGFSFSLAYNYPHINIIVLPLIAFIVSIILYLYLLNSKSNNNLDNLSISLIIGGALGNAADRIFHGYVIDFINVTIFSLKNLPVFNFADMFITIGVILIFISEIFFKRSKKS